VDTCGVCGGDGSSCDLRVEGYIWLSRTSRQLEFDALFYAALPGISMTVDSFPEYNNRTSSVPSRDTSRLLTQRKAATYIDPHWHAKRLLDSSSSAFGYQRMGQGSDHLLRKNCTHPVETAWTRSDEPSLEHVGSSKGRQLTRVGAWPVTYLVPGGRTVSYTGASIASAFVRATTEAAERGIVTDISTLPLVQILPIPGNSVCEGGETPENAVGDCQEARICASPAGIGEPIPCGGNGACNYFSGVCLCSLGYVGLDCGQCSPGYVPKTVYYSGEARGYVGISKVQCSAIAPIISTTPGPSNGSTASSGNHSDGSGKVGVITRLPGSDGSAGKWWRSWYGYAAAAGSGALVAACAIAAVSAGWKMRRAAKVIDGDDVGFRRILVMPAESVGLPDDPTFLESAQARLQQQRRTVAAVNTALQGFDGETGRGFVSAANGARGRAVDRENGELEGGVRSLFGVQRGRR
jgi:hypothetical protein